MAEMVERVARAMFHAECEPHKAVTGYGDTFGWDDAMPAVRERLTACARAAIEAMRSPTEAMRSAVDKAEDEGGCIAAAYEHIEWDKAWPVAIDAALE